MAQCLNSVFFNLTYIVHKIVVFDNAIDLFTKYQQVKSGQV